MSFIVQGQVCIARCVCEREREGVYMCVRMCVRVYVCARIRDAAGYKSSGV